MEYIVDPREREWKVFEPDGERLNLLFDKNIEPIASLNRLFPRRRVARHSHPVDEFQIFLKGSAIYPEFELEAPSVHYFEARRPYGPFISGPEGLLFLELTA